MAQQTVTELVVEDASAAGVASYVRGMRTAQRARDDLTDTEMAAQRAQQRSTAVMLGLSDSTNRTRQAWQRLREGIDPVTRAQREFEQAALRSDAALRRGLATQNEVNRVLQVYRQRLRETQQAQREPSAFAPITNAAQGALQGFAGRSAVGGALAGMGGAGAAAGAVVAGLGAATGAVVVYGDAWVGLGNRLKGAGIASADLATEQQKVVDIAMSSRSELTATNDLYSKFIGVTQTLGVEQGKAAIATKAVAQALTLGGVSAAQAQGTILQLGQALGSGVLRGDEFNSVMEGLGNQSPLIKAIAAEFGVATSELRGLAEAGELVSDRVFNAIIKAQPAITAAFEKMDPTLDGAWNNATTAATNFFGAINEGLGVSNLFANALLAIANNANLAAEGLRKAGAVERSNADFARQMREKYGVFGSNMYDNAATNQQYQDDLSLRRRLYPGGYGPGRRPSGPGAPYGGPDEAVRGGALSELTRRQIWMTGIPLPPPRPSSEKGEREGYLYNDADDPTKVKTPRKASTALTPAERGENAFERALAEQQRRNELLSVEADNIGKSSAERERAETIINLEAKAVEANRLAKMADISVTDQQRMAILAMADATAQATQRLQEAKEAEKERISAMDSMRDATKGTISDIAHGIAEGKSGKEIAKALLTKLSSSMIDTGAQNLTDLLLAKQGKEGGGLIGGFISNLLGAPKTTATMAVTAGVVNVGGVGIPGFGAANSNMPLTGSGSVTSAPLPPASYAAQMNGGGPGASFQGAAAAAAQAIGGGPSMSAAEAKAFLQTRFTGSKGGITGLNDDFAIRLAAFEKANPGISTFSGYRSIEHQARLFAASDRSGRMVAPPGRSQHNFGNAADLRFATPEAREWAHQNAGQYGLEFPMSWENWHIQPIKGWKGSLQADPMAKFDASSQGLAVNPLAQLTPAIKQLGTAAQQTTPALADVSKGTLDFGGSLGSLGSMLGGAIGGPKGSAIGGGVGGILSSIFSLFQFADGGIMTPRGPLPLMAYAGGGIVDRPQVRIAGEGSMNEAIVPLPNGRSIPVQMRGMNNNRPQRGGAGGFSFRGGDNNFTFNGGKPDEEMLSAMKREVAASEARTKADMVRNWAAYQQAHANGFG